MVMPRCGRARASRIRLMARTEAISTHPCFVVTGASACGNRASVIPILRSRSSTRPLPAIGCSTRPWNGSPPAADGPRGRSGSATAAACSGATSRTTASCAGTRRPARSAFPQALRLRQRQHPRPRRAGSSPASTARGVSRARNMTARSSCLADRFEGKRAQLAQRLGVQVRRLALVHRSALRHPRQLRGLRRPSRAAAQRLPRRSATGAADAWSPSDVNGPNGLAFSPDESKLYVVEFRRPRRASSSPTTSRTRRASPTAAS